MDFDTITNLLDKNGWPAVLFAAFCVAAWRIWVFMAPRIDTAFSKHFHLLDKATESFTSQNEAMSGINENVSKLSSQLDEHHRVVLGKLEDKP